ncbi:MAG: cytochrome C oxidase subunit IV family protein [Saprospiraceae bacterium]|jgi:cytochrome c oxidase subunit IV|nr:cytochrome C oxidase subunit IV family protein [Saprospiraceae bacterium]
MQHLSYEASIKRVYYGLKLLAFVTVVEVLISLFGKGHLGWHEVKEYKVVLYAVGIIIAVLSLYKAYFIIYEFMHMRYEVKGLAMSVLLPTALLIWAIIAFFQEGNSWKNRREQIKEKNEAAPKESSQPTGYLGDDVYRPDWKG